MKIARPLLLVTTPIGVLAGVREAWRFLMAGGHEIMVLFCDVGAFFFYTWRTIRRESG